MLTRALRHVHGTDEAHKVTTLELFFDLVFVFAITQVTQLMADEPTLRGAVRGGLLLALLWFAWTSFAWLGNTAKADEGVLRLALVGAVVAMFVVALAIPEAFGDTGGGLDAPLVLALSYATVRLAHIVVYLVVASDDADLRKQLLTTLVPVAGSMGLLVAGSVQEHQIAWWAAAVVIDYGGVYAAGTSGWRLPSPGHFTERHGLIVLIAIGESMVSIGVGVSGKPLTGPVVLASVLGIAVAVCLWWLYFDVVAIVAEHVLSELPVEERPRLARDSYTYLHFPMVAGIVFLSLGMKKGLTYVSEHDLSDVLHGMPLYSLYGGVGAYLFAHLAFRRRNIGSINRPRLLVLLVVLGLVPVAEHAPALAALGVVAGLLTALVSYEAVRYSAGRTQVRHGESHG